MNAIIWLSFSVGALGTLGFGCVQPSWTEYRVAPDSTIRFVDPKDHKIKILAATNAPCFLTKQEDLTTRDSHGHWIVDPRKLALAQASPYSRPEANDRDGNWGPAEQGFRISLRFERPQFHTGEVIRAIVLVRNVSTQVLGYFIGEEYPQEFVVRNSRNTEIPPNNRKPPTLPPLPLGAKRLPLRWPCVISPGMQTQQFIEFEKIFELEANDTYTIFVEKTMENRDGKGKLVIRSGAASIKIVP